MGFIATIRAFLAELWHFKHRQQFIPSLPTPLIPYPQPSDNCGREDYDDRSYSHTWELPVWRGGKPSNMACPHHSNISTLYCLSYIRKQDYSNFNPVPPGRSKSLDHLCADTGIDFNLNDYMRIHEALQFYVLSRRNDDPEPEQSTKFF